MSVQAEDLLADELRLALGAARIVGLTKLSGGASRETWAFGDGVNDYVLRRDPPGTSRSEGAVDRATEARVIEAARAAGAPAPEVVARFGEDAFIMRRATGTAEPRAILRDATFADARRRLVADCGRALGRIHRTPFDALPALPLLDAEAQIALYREALDRLGAVRPVFELALRWLALHRLPATETVLVHGDFRLGNLMFDAQGLTAALDWELCHLGDPAEDLGWLSVRSWRFGGSGEVGGVGSVEDLLASYDRVVDPARVRYWQIFGTFKWGVICLIQADRHLSGREASLEHAAIGRRASEAEYDLMNLID